MRVVRCRDLLLPEATSCSGGEGGADGVWMTPASMTGDSTARAPLIPLMVGCCVASPSPASADAGAGAMRS
eukprot:CAMPEP_0115875118 /NCGR_PEP_ID=MMETSP0287-20121206/24919_1 /TAXON_ID=412157 /ORGANISM="Chrysochromulina rotalis, Strain UIO044" /LENGTH=70 /DNA_ID=CAMNT_0003330345 /DNA_START=183 /DNA_END=395 /DNA_ORIENTATION=+